MLGTILVLAALGVGIFSWLLMTLYAPISIPNKVIAVLAVAAWVGMAWLGTVTDSKAGFFVVCGICWVLDLLAGSMFLVFLSDD